MDFDTAIKKPFTSGKKLLIGTLLSILPIIRWFAQGFIIECSGVGKNKASKKMPEFKNWSDLFFKGFITNVIGFLYMLPAVIIFAIGIGSAALNFFRVMAREVIAGKAAEINVFDLIPNMARLVPLMVIVGALLILAYYVLPIAVLRFLDKKRFTNAFNLDKVFRKAFTANYFVVWLVFIIVSMIVTAVLSYIPIVGAAFAFFMTGVFGYTLFGEVYRKK